MTAVVEAREPSAKYLSTLQPPLVQHFELMATAPGGVAKLRELILTLAVQGKLVPQDPKDEPASELLDKISAARERLIAEGKARRCKPSEVVTEEEKSFALPVGWEWVRLGDVQIFTNGYAFKSMHFAESGVGVVRIGNVHDGEITTTGMVYLPDSMAGEVDNQFFVEPGDLVITMTGDVKLGFNRTGNRFLLNQRVGKITPLLVVPTYLVFCMSLVAEQKIADASGSVIPNVSTGEINATPLALPPLAEQARIVTRVEELMRLCDTLEAKGQLEAAQHAQLVQTLLDALTASTSPEELADNWQRVATHFDRLLDRPEAIDALEQTILQLAVRGLLVPQDPKDEPASELLKKIRAEKDSLISEGRIKKDKPLPNTSEDEIPFELPDGWSWASLSDVVYKITDGEHLSPPKATEGMPLLTAKDVTNEGVLFHSTQFVSHENGTRYRQRCDPEKGDILICSRGTIGRCAAIETDQVFCLMGSVILLKVPHQIAYQYLLLHLRTDIAQAWMRGVSSATAVSALYLKDVARCLVPIAPKSEQLRIVARVESLRRLCTDLRQRLAARQTTQAHLAEALIDEVV